MELGGGWGETPMTSSSKSWKSFGVRGECFGAISVELEPVEGSVRERVGRMVFFFGSKGLRSQRFGTSSSPAKASQLDISGTPTA